ncbi:MAG TPA: PEGA domain-containing protein, partial [Polyangiaceae bacterium]|nr:PEGA domain-containing protein [Polyangiaceae bacterium]
GAPASDTESAAPDPAKKAEAEAHFTKGLDLLNEEAWTAALAEFLASRELYPTRTATNNAAVCLRKLKRFDESLDMFETVLREFPNMPADKKEAAQKEVAELRQLVGTIDIGGAEPGAAIAVDGRPKQDYPLIDPLRVSAGSHTVRLFKEGFQPFEATVDVAGGQTVKIEAKMPALAASGRLRVVEQNGKRLDVVVDGAVVGVTPWEGTIGVGEHVVLLQGDGDMGTQPTRAPIKKDESSTLTLSAELLESGILVKSTPSAAKIVIDGIPVGRGIWDGRLRKGAHTVESTYDGYFPKKKDVSLDRGERQEITFELERDEDADRWRLPSKITFDLVGGFALSPSFGGDVQSGCGDGCSGTLGLGGLVMAHGGYEWGSGIGIGLSAGFMQASQSDTGRSTSITPQGLDPLTGTTDDDVRIRGYLVGVHGAYRIGEDFPLRFRLGAGALIGQVHATRTGAFTTRAGSAYDAPEVGSNGTAAFVYIDPEATIGIKLGDTFEIGAGAQALILIAAAAPTFGGDANPSFNAPGDGLSSYNADETTMGTTVFVVPQVTARASF